MRGVATIVGGVNEKDVRFKGWRLPVDLDTELRMTLQGV